MQLISPTDPQTLRKPFKVWPPHAPFAGISIMVFGQFMFSVLTDINVINATGCRGPLLSYVLMPWCHNAIIHLLFLPTIFLRPASSPSLYFSSDPVIIRGERAGERARMDLMAEIGLLPPISIHALLSVPCFWDGLTEHQKGLQLRGVWSDKIVTCLF